MSPSPTTEELRAAFNANRLLHLQGMSFERAIAIPLLRTAIECTAKARRRAEEARRGHALPVQEALL
mgnify:CR=1 FL=1